MTDLLGLTVPFTLKTFDTLDPEYLTAGDLHLDTARYWALHLRADDPEATWLRLRATGSEALTGDALGGDSFIEWCEPAAGHPEALHVYFQAPALPDALRVAQALCVAIGITSPKDVTLSTAGDWAEQAEVW